MEYICKDYKSKPMEGKRFKSGSLDCIPTSTRAQTADCLPPEVKIRKVSINNLNEFICENVLSEFLRQNNIFVAKCVPSLAYNERSRNFHVLLRESDLEKVLVPDLWPEGVSVSIQDEKNRKNSKEFRAIHGRREKNLPGVVITSGMSYWHS